jgi:rare lipoprotein A
MKWLFLSGLALLFAAQTSVAQSKETGLAGMYSDAFHGRVTASGFKYNKDEFTGAHKTLPMGTRVKVTMVEGGGSTVVEITDRGPYEQGRILELSRAAATEIGLDKKGYAQVRLEVVDKNTALGTKSNAVANVAATVVPQPETKPEVKPVVPETKTTVTSPAKTETKPAATVTTPAKTETKTSATTTKTETKPAATVTTPAKTETKTSATVTKTETKTPAATTSSTKSTETKPKEAAKIESGGLYKMQVLEMPKEGYGVQVGGFSDYQAATEKVSELQKQWFKGAMVYVGERNSAPYYRVILGPFFTKDEADSYNESLKAKHKIKDAFVVDLKSLGAK